MSFSRFTSRGDGRQRWVELGVDADPPLSPRIALTAVRYAFRVNHVGSQELDNNIALGDDTADPFYCSATKTPSTRSR